MAIYNNIFVVLNGSVLVESVSVETSLTRSGQPVFSIADQFVGVSPSPTARQISVKNVIPLKGSERVTVDDRPMTYEEMMVEHTPVEIMLQEGVTGRVTISRGLITSVKRGGGVGQTSVLSFEFIGSGLPFV